MHGVLDVWVGSKPSSAGSFSDECERTCVALACPIWWKRPTTERIIRPAPTRVVLIAALNSCRHWWSGASSRRSTPRHVGDLDVRPLLVPAEYGYPTVVHRVVGRMFTVRSNRSVGIARTPCRSHDDGREIADWTLADLFAQRLVLE